MSQKQIFICPHCNKIFKNPILLPCYDTICEHHLREKMVLKQKSIECKTCKQTFNLDESFKSGPNKHLQTQLDHDIHLSDEEKSLKNALLESCANLDQMIREYHESKASLASESIKAHFDRLRLQLDERRKSLHGKIDEIYFEMIEKTTNCEESVLKNLANNFKAVEVLQLPNQKNLANEINEKFREANLELNLLREQLNKSEHEIVQLKKRLDEIAEISKHFASSNYFEFKLLFNHEHFGSLHLNDLRSNIRSHKQVLDFPPIIIENTETMQGIVENNVEEEEGVILCYQNPIKRKRIDDEENLLASQILTSQQLSSELIRLCEFSPNDRFTLLYRGTRDGFGSRDFHSKCDNHSNTLTICKTSQKKRRECERSKLKAPEFAYICGGFTTVKWESLNKWKHVSDPNAFVFSLTNKDNKPCKLSVNPKKHQYAVCCYSGSGPKFGDDIFIADDSNLTMSSSKLGEHYKLPEDVRPGENEAFSFLAGTEDFYLSEIEVYKKGE